MSKSKRPKDSNQLAKLIVDVTVGNEASLENKETNSQKNLAAVELGRLGGLKGGKARAEKLSSDERSLIAKKAAKARWSKKSDDI